MAEQLLGKGDYFEAHMPEVDILPNIEKVFAEARKAAAAESETGRDPRRVVVVTPGRMLMLQPCPPPGTMAKSAVKQIEKVAPPKVKRKIAVIGYTELRAITSDVAKAIPFFELLSGLAYIGHSVWVFEGHRSALAEGCKVADLLIVDSAMVPHLAADWQAAACSGKPTLQIYVHDRATKALRRAI
jgi:hypothetical protein